MEGDEETMDIVHYFNIVLHPQETMTADVKDAELKKAMKPFAIFGALAGLVIGLGIAAGGMIGGLGALSIAAVIIVPIVLAILMVLGTGFSSGLYFLVAKLVGGKGTFVQNYYLNARLFWPVLFASIIAVALTLIPFVGWLFQIIWVLYSIYLSIMVISVANNISKLRALIVYVLPTIIAMIILFIVLGSIIMGILAGAGAASIPTTFK